MRQSGTIDTSGMGTYSSALAKDVCGLQAADLLAYELTREFENSLQRPELAMRKSLKRLLAKDYRQGLFKFFSFETLLETLMDSGVIAEKYGYSFGFCHASTRCQDGHARKGRAMILKEC